jgi:hypothetical protein
MSAHGPDAVLQQAFLAVCELDVTALKPGNVRTGRPAHGMRISSAARAPALGEG